MVGGLSLEEWSSASRCEDWTVQDVVAHIVGVNAFWRVSVRAGLAGEPTRFLAGFDPRETPALMVAQMRELTPAEVLGQLVDSNDAFLDVLGKMADDDWKMLAEAPPGHLQIRLVVQHALWDCWIHERDIAIPLGLTPPTEVDEVCSCLSYVSALSPALAIGSGVHIHGQFAVQASGPMLSCLLDIGQTVAVRAAVAPQGAPCLHGDAVALVEALSLRAPLPASAPAGWLQLLQGLATAFGVELPKSE